MALLCQCLGILFCCISMATVSWVNGTPTQNLSAFFVSVGLWKACLNGVCIYMNEYNNMIANVLGKGWLTSCQACAASGIAILCVTGLLAVAFLISERCRQNLRILQVLTALVTAGAVCYAFTLLLFGIETYHKQGLVQPDNYLYYGSSFYLGIGGVASCVLAAILYLLEYNKQIEPRIKYVVLN